MEIGVENCLIKPVKRSLLFDSIMEIFGYKIAAYQEVSARINTGDISFEAFSDIHILLAEDHPVNRRVAIEILKLSGISADTALNGLEAVEAVKKKNYDAVFMDIQMPEMDGIKATKAIRKWEEEAGNSELGTRNQFQVSSFKRLPIPIIAMTAHAMTGDREKCLKAGMNDYIAKPIDHKELFAVLRRNIPQLRNVEINKKSDIRLPASDFQFPIFPGIDIKEGVDRLGGAWEIYADILSDFCNIHKNFIQEFHKLIEKKDFENARLKAHGLKGAAGNVSAINLRTVAKVLEEACKAEDREIILKKLPPVKDALLQVREAFEKISVFSVTEKDSANAVKTESSKQVPVKEVSHKDIREMLQELDKYLEDFDPVESEHCFKKISACFTSGSCETEWDDLEKLIKDYNFDDARHTLSKISQRFET
ncbi:response regulator [Desulfonema magnum]|uniref:Two component system response regulator n=1 Tax=Desulfonema magnum TaxID=45655 RepID=A0A975BMF0_9BACT|nr:response regulator [Desulfonema magnum]QTA87684.1 Two component system response regulator [Desulfonema magnum]